MKGGTYDDMLVETGGLFNIGFYGCVNSFVIEEEKVSPRGSKRQKKVSLNDALGTSALSEVPCWELERPTTATTTTEKK